VTICSFQAGSFVWRLLQESWPAWTIYSIKSEWLSSLDKIIKALDYHYFIFCFLLMIILWIYDVVWRYFTHICLIFQSVLRSKYQELMDIEKQEVEMLDSMWPFTFMSYTWLYVTFHLYVLDNMWPFTFMSYTWQYVTFHL